MPVLLPSKERYKLWEEPEAGSRLATREATVRGKRQGEKEEKENQPGVLLSLGLRVGF